MEYPELVKKVQYYSGCTLNESEDALQVTVESLSVHLTEQERRHFASQLPAYLQDIALSVLATDTNSKEDVLQQFMYLQHVDERRAKRQLLASWRAIKEAISSGEIKHIKAQLPKSANHLLI